jgi:lysozyme family protein
MRSDKFEHAVSIVLHHEGGLVDHPSDPGGVTNYGISLRWARAAMIRAGDDALRHLDIDGDGDVTADDIRKMTRDDARALYYKFFWQPGNYDSLRHQYVAVKVFDMAVNLGPVQAHKLAQRAVRAATLQDLADDGILGPKSRSAINGAAPNMLLATLRSEHAGFYRALIIRNSALRNHGVQVPDFKVFEQGWLRRAYS